ncbi:tryptophan synthase subunit alpha [Elusimicrobiota bacterium]
MNKLKIKINQLKQENKKAFVAYLTAGFPTLNATAEMVKVLADNGADIIELGVPFSDPMADGPSIQYSSEYAIKKGANLNKIFDLVKKIRQKTDIPIVLMSYFNPIYHMGIKNVVRKAKDVGVDGFIIPDLIPEEGKDFEKNCKDNNLSVIFMAAPNTPKERLKYIDSKSDGFVYVVSLTGVTGKRKSLPSHLKEFLNQTKRYIKKNKRFIGFGISSEKHVNFIKKYVDGVIVGSVLVEIIRNGKTSAKNKQIARFARLIRKSLDG